MGLQPGARLGPYEVTAPLGSGGMGEVFRARDARLGREVAVKVLPEGLSSDPERLRRFEREAHAVSALNHPNVLTVYDAGVHEGRPYLVTELLEGETLAAILVRGRLSVRRALDYGTQAARGLAAAHEKGIVHRDLKPTNLFVTGDGRLKILDFGLAKPELELAAASLFPGATTETLDTSPGVVLGTLGYMSPEQLRGLPTDARTDLFALGAVLYEMVSGQAAFGGASAPDVMSAVLYRDPPELAAAGVSPPPALERIVRRCLEKQPASRFHSALDLAFQLETLSADSAPAPSAGPVPAQPTRWRAGWAAMLGIAVTAAAAGWSLHGALAKRARARSVQLQRLTDMVGLEEAPAISPDGKTVAFVAAAGGRRQIWVRLLAGGAPLALTKDEVDHYGPRWSPDSLSLIYYTPGAQPGDAGTIWEIPALGGPGRRLATALGPGDLSHDGKNLAFFRFREGAMELAVAARDRSDTRTVTRLPSAIHTNPRWSPDDRWLAYTHELGGVSFSTGVMVVSAQGGEPRRVAGDFYFQGATWTPDSSSLIVSSAQGSLMSYPPMYNLWTIPVAGGPRSQLTFGEASYEFPDLGAQGKLVVSRVRAHSDVWKFPVSGEPGDNARRGVRVTRQTGLLQTVSVSPDESDVVFLSDNGGHANVWTAGTASGEMRPVTREADPRVVVAVPVWSPRGDWINFLSTRNSGTSDVTLWLVRPDGSEPRDLGIFGVWACWSGDGQWLYYSDRDKGAYRIRKMRIDGGEPVTVRDDDATGCSLAPDGSALYYAKAFAQAAGFLDWEIRVARPENGPSTVVGRVSGARVPATAVNFHALVSPDGKWLAMPLLDGSTTNLWALSTTGGAWRRLTDFGARNVMIARRIAWSKDGKYLYASVSDVDSDIVMFVGLR